jgi:hypothetical protein
MKQPPGFVHSLFKGKVCRLNKTLYGLKQSPREWYEEVLRAFHEMAFTRCQHDHSIFIKQNDGDTLIVGVYVDDMIVAARTTDAIDAFGRNIGSRYKVKDLGEIKAFLGLEIVRDRANRRIFVSQRRYLEGVLDAYNMRECHPTATPLNPGVRLQADAAEDEVLDASVPYREALGSLMYAMVGTRPDLAFAVGLASRYLSQPRQSHWKAVKQILAYVKGTLDVGLVYGGLDANAQLVGYTDADWANDVDTRRSVTGMVFTLAGGAVSWKSRRQPTVALSSTEAEYMAAAEAAAEAIWLRGLLNELGAVQHGATSIYEDNHGAIKISRNDCSHSRTKHIDVRYHFVRERVQAGEIELTSVSTTEQPADVLTKSVARTKHQMACHTLGLARRAEVLGMHRPSPSSERRGTQCQVE